MPEVIDYDRLMEQERLNVVIADGGGRGHALEWKLLQAARIGNISRMPYSPSLIDFATNPDNAVDLVVFGAQAGLAEGAVNTLTSEGIAAFGPTSEAAYLETYRPEAKERIQDLGIPTAAYGVFDKPRLAHEFIEAWQKPVYVKAAGDAGGHGALQGFTLMAAHCAVEDIMVRRKFGDAGAEVVIEEYLFGNEVSLHAFCDGETYLMLPLSQDYKKLDDSSEGLNTGGVGAISPVPGYSQEQTDVYGDVTIRPVLSAFHKEGINYNGVIYPGLMVANGMIRVLEYNVRFGDPETQVYVRRLGSDLLEIITSTVAHRLDRVKPVWSDKYAVCIVAASEGYPEEFEVGKRIHGIERANALDDVEVFLAGTIEQDREFLTSGGRVLGVTAVAETLSDAIDLGYEAMDEIYFEGKVVNPYIGAQHVNDAFG
ncbi:MAG TPA: phosphoribosylamine--glycine ligase [Candidatus Saccharimonadales bacterium]|nr:phosphoribosylamine--glycine ligase [Candidatus Saccharimonadales bacterium]